MEVKLTFSSVEILNKVFPSAPRGYDALMVDQFLDEILKDYQLIEANALLEMKSFEDLKQKVTRLENEKRNLEIENSRLKARFSNLKEDDNVNADNIDLIRRIRALEKFLFQNGFDPRNIK